jgi:hypothetical protein
MVEALGGGDVPTQSRACRCFNHALCKRLMIVWAARISRWMSSSPRAQKVSAKNSSGLIANFGNALMIF